MGHEVPRLLIEYRDFELRSTYVDALPGFIHPQTGAITRASIRPGRHGRLSSSDPNLQNIPVRTRAARPFAAPSSLRPAPCSHVPIIPDRAAPPGPSLSVPKRAGRDIHPPDGGDHLRRGARTSHRGYASPRQDDQLRHDLRQGRSLSPTARITQDDAKRFIEQYFTRFAGVRAWLDRTVAEARERGMSRHCAKAAYIPELKDRNYNIRALASGPPPTPPSRVRPRT